MVNLIVTLIGIVLLAAISVAALMNLGDSFMMNSSRADYARLMNESNHIAMASRLYANDNNRSPTSIDDLVQENYLRHMYKGITRLTDGEGNPIETSWEFAFDDFAAQMLEGDQMCASINRVAGGSGNVSDIPSCSANYDPQNPCCRITESEMSP